MHQKKKKKLSGRILMDESSHHGFISMLQNSRALQTKMHLFFWCCCCFKLIIFAAMSEVFIRTAYKFWSCNGWNICIVPLAMELKPINRRWCFQPFNKIVYILGRFARCNWLVAKIFATFFSRIREFVNVLIRKHCCEFVKYKQIPFLHNMPGISFEMTDLWEAFDFRKCP